MDLKGPIKSVITTGNLKENKLIYKLCPVTEFSDGVWNVAVKSISYVCQTENLKEICKITSNLSKAQKFNNSFEVESYEQPFGIFLLEEGKHVISFGKDRKYKNL